MDETAKPIDARAPKKRSRIWLITAILAAIVALAWFDGGEEALHPISHEIAVPENTE